MKNLTRGILFLVVALLLAIGTSTAEAQNQFAAIAYSPSTGAYGYGNGYPTKAAAIARALRECGQRDARTNWTKNAWIALAVSENRGFGWAWSTTAGKARAAAIEQCLKYNADARVVVCIPAKR